jgi:hypothetical protein
MKQKNVKPKAPTELSIGQLRRLAVMQFQCEELNFDDVEEMAKNEEVDGYISLTDEEAQEMASENIKESVWAFNASFLAYETGLDEQIFQEIIDNGKCEGNNGVIYNTIVKTCGIESFIESAISADGRGCFMNSYDGEENEVIVNGQTFYIYRMI